MNPEKLRQDFPIFSERPELVYLDNAATSQKPDTVIERISEFYEKNNSNVGRGLYDLAGDATGEYGKARRKVAGFIGSDSEEVIFTKNTTESENLVANSLDFEGDIVLSEMSHHSEQLPWRRRAKQEGKEIRWLETEDGRISLESARQKIDEETGMVAVSHISNVFGAENPVSQIVDLAHENDAFVVLDGAQSVPHMPVDIGDLEVDFMCFSGHKMLGPMGIGVLYGRRELLHEMEPYQLGGGMIRKVEKSGIEYEEIPGKFEAGTENVAGAVGLGEAADYLEEVGMEDIYENDRKLSSSIIRELRDIEGIEVVSPEDASLVSFRADFAHPHDIAEILSQNDVAVRAGHHCAQIQMEQMDLSGTVRASPYLYNTEKDVERFVEAVREVREVFS
ncbi:MAG: aminotransferase class V-fold PLP-dependent enzyme, partial [Candidatus Nanohaloarchaea archaeon]